MALPALCHLTLMHPVGDHSYLCKGTEPGKRLSCFPLPWARIQSSQSGSKPKFNSTVVSSIRWNPTREVKLWCRHHDLRVPSLPFRLQCYAPRCAPPTHNLKKTMKELIPEYLLIRQKQKSLPQHVAIHARVAGENLYHPLFWWVLEGG